MSYRKKLRQKSWVLSDVELLNLLNYVENNILKCRCWRSGREGEFDIKYGKDNQY